MPSHEIGMERFDEPGFLEQVRRLLHEDGFVLLRRAVSPHRCRAYRTMLDRTIDFLAEWVKGQGIDIDGIGDADVHAGRLQSLAWNIKAG